MEKLSWYWEGALVLMDVFKQILSNTIWIHPHLNTFGD